MERPIPRTYAEWQQQSFVDGLGEIYRDVLLSHAPNCLQYGPTYLVQTSQGKTLRISTLCSLIPRPYGPMAKEAELTWIMLAQDTFDGSLVGYRQTAFRRERDQKGEYDRCQGDIGTAKRGKGIAIPIELAHLDLLRRIANLTGTRLIHEIEDGNLNTLMQLRKSLDSHSDDQQTSLLLKQREKEHERWLVIYGPGGRLGYNKNGRRQFVKSNADCMLWVPFDEVDKIVIYRIDEHKLATDGVCAIPVYDSEEINPDIIRDKKRKYYEIELLPKVEQVLGIE